MAVAYKLDGVMKWAARPEWADSLQEMIDRHIAAVCDLYDLGPEELAGLIGEAGVMNLWGCAFEDMLARDFDGRNVADDYLKRRGWKESTGTRAYVKALRNATMSLYEVSGIKRDEGFFVRDLLRGSEPVWVHEKLGSQQLTELDRIATRVIEVNGRLQVGGAVLPFSREASEEAITVFESMKNANRKEMSGLVATLVEEMATEDDLPEGVGSLEELKKMLGTMVAEAEDGPVGIESALATGAWEFTNLWLEHTLEKLIGSPPLDFGDDDDDEWIETRYPLAKGVKQADIAATLSSVPALMPMGKKFWNWLGREGKPEEGQLLFGGADDTIVLGTLELEGRMLTLTVETPEQVENGRKLVEKTLHGLVGDPID